MPSKLHRYAALGETKKLEKCLEKHSVTVDAADFEGSTALHQVPVRAGNLSAFADLFCQEQTLNEYVACATGCTPWAHSGGESADEVSIWHVHLSSELQLNIHYEF